MILDRNIDLIRCDEEDVQSLENFLKMSMEFFCSAWDEAEH